MLALHFPKLDAIPYVMIIRHHHIRLRDVCGRWAGLRVLFMQGMCKLLILETNID